MFCTYEMGRKINAYVDELHARAAEFAPPLMTPLQREEIFTASSFPFFGRLLRSSYSVEHLAGVAPAPPFLRAVQLTAVPDSVYSAADVVVALQRTLHECTLLAAQEALISNSACLRIALLQHLIVEVIPLPLPLDHPERSARCFWASGLMRYETQAQLLRLLHQIAKHHAAASLCLELTRELDAARIVATACVAAIADAVMRVRACDTPSVLSDHYSGRAGGPSKPFGVDHHPFAVESETLKFTEPSLIIARGMVLDYFSTLRRKVPIDHHLFRWEASAEFGEGELLLVGQVCDQFGFPIAAGSTDYDVSSGSNSPMLRGVHDRVELPADWRAAYLTGELAELMELYPEFGAFRDILFLFKLFMCPQQHMLPERQRWRPCDAHLTWAHRMDDRPKRMSHVNLVVIGFGLRHDSPTPLNIGISRSMRGEDGNESSWRSNLATIASNIFGAKSTTAGQTIRPRAPPSNANPDVLLRAAKVSPTDKFTFIATEDDALAIDSDTLLDMQRSTGTVDDSLQTKESKDGAETRPPLSARDAELLLTYLTAPYLRIPLLLQFFADQQRLGALSSPRIQDVLEAALFEPSTWQEDLHRPVPIEIPPIASERASVLATPLGLLFNELVHSPSLVLEPLERLLEMALDMDTGYHGGASARILFFIVRLIVRVESFALLLLAHAKWRRLDGHVQSDSREPAMPVRAPTSNQYPEPSQPYVRLQLTADGSSVVAFVHIKMPCCSAPRQERRHSFNSTLPSLASLHPENEARSKMTAHARADGKAISVEPSRPGCSTANVSKCGCRVIARGLDISLQAAHEQAAMYERVASLRLRLDGQVFELLEKWFSKASSTKDVRSACTILAHLALLFQNKMAEEIDCRAMTTVLASQVFLTHNFDWHIEQPKGNATVPERAADSVGSSNGPTRSFDERELGMPQTQVFSLFQRHRRTILQRLRAFPAECAQVLEAVTRIVTFTGTRHEGSTQLAHRRWVEMANGDHRNAGRFVVASPSRAMGTVCSESSRVPQPALSEQGQVSQREAAQLSAESSAGGSTGCTGDADHVGLASETLASNGARDAREIVGQSFGEWLACDELARSAQLEINVQLGEYCTSSHKQMRVLPPEIVAGVDDFSVVFGTGTDALSFQSAEVESTPQRTWLRLVGQRHDLHRWSTDERSTDEIYEDNFASPLTFPYQGLLPTLPGGLTWVQAILDPVRMAHFPEMRLFAPPNYLHANPLNVVLLESRGCVHTTRRPHTIFAHIICVLASSYRLNGPSSSARVL